MKKILLLVAVVILLTGCGNTTQQETTTTTEVETTTEITTEEEVTVNEMEPEEALKGYSNYSKEYIEEVYYNTIDSVVTYKEWKALDDAGYGDNRIMFILLKQYGILK